MKKILVLVIALIIVFSLCSCKKKNNDVLSGASEIGDSLIDLDALESSKTENTGNVTTQAPSAEEPQPQSDFEPADDGTTDDDFDGGNYENPEVEK